MALAQVFEAIAGPDAPVEFQAYDGSSAGIPGSPVKITVRSPVAVSYLAQAPGALGLARAYVSGHLDVDGNMFMALSRLSKAQDSEHQLGRPDQAPAGPRRPEGAVPPDRPAAAGGRPRPPPVHDRRDALQEP